MSKQCENCFYGRDGGPGVVICQRYPPTITNIEGTQVTSHFPLLAPNIWCGEWKQGIEPDTVRHIPGQPYRGKTNRSVS